MQTKTPPSALDARRQELPIYLLFRESSAAEEVALDLRQHGFRARTFVNLDVFKNAARSQPPAAVILQLDLITDAKAGLDLAVVLEEASGRPVPIIYVDEGADFASRLRAVQAGGTAFFPLPINRAALLHHLHQLAAPKAELAPRVVVAADAGGSLAAAAAALAEAGLAVNTVENPAALLETLAASPCDLLILGDELLGVEAAELAQVVRQTGTYSDLPILVLTQADKRRLDEAATGAGVDALIGLPIEAKDLLAIVHARARRARSLRSAYQYLARREAATGLFNVGYFSESLRHAVLEAAAGAGGALLYLELQIQPAPPGKETQQRLLAHLAEFLRTHLPAFAIPCRISADGIAVLLPAADAAAAERLTLTLSERLRRLDVVLRGQNFQFSARVGVTLLTGRHRTAKDALGQAREAAAIQAGAPAQPSQATSNAADDHWLNEIKQALRSNRFRLVYQPVASLNGQPTPYYEVFVRMLDADGGDILPQEFLPAAEQGGIAAAIDRWVVNRAVHVLEEQKTLQHKPVLFVKLLADTVSDPGFYKWLRDRLQSAGISAERLVLQLTQRTAITRAAETAALVRELRQLGCLVAIEHFGAGGDVSADLIKALTPNFIKLSPQLTQDIGTNAEHQKAVQAVTGLSRTVGARTVAALVQDAVNLSVLWRCGVEYIQGYFMQEPVDVFSETETLSG
jgi:EAL domain-containing protein (putative c-di-GMP-specific phosphodiesterase class I)/DNA-binding response OmpR family regulator